LSRTSRTKWGACWLRRFQSLTKGGVLPRQQARRLCGENASEYFRARDPLEPVAATELATRLRDGSVVLLDVRPEDEYSLGHLPGALNVPLRQWSSGFPGYPANTRSSLIAEVPIASLVRSGGRLARAWFHRAPVRRWFSRVEGRMLAD
jgi:ArsR family transcriptional regulator